MRVFKLFFIVILCWMPGGIASAQDFSNKGKDFWLCYPGHIDGVTSRMALYISATNNASGVVRFNGQAINFSVQANQATTVQILPQNYNIIHSTSNEIKQGYGIHITASEPVVVYAHVLNSARSASSLILPSATLGREYIAASYPSVINSTSAAPTSNTPSGSQFEVVAVEDTTLVEITPTANDISGNRRANVAFTVSLNKGDVYQYRTTFSEDVTGSIIRSISAQGKPCRPIAVFSGSSWAAFGCGGANSGDNLFQQLMPKSSWGKNYITIPFQGRPHDIFRILIDDPSTSVAVNGKVLDKGLLRNNSYYEFADSKPTFISTDKPVNVLQYMISQNCDMRNRTNAALYSGDPEMIILNPIEQTLSDITVVSARRDLTPPNTNITDHYINIVMKTNATASFTIDGAKPKSSFVPIGSSEFSYLAENVTSSTTDNPSHRLLADSGFIAIAYGSGSLESYGYNAGTNVKDLYQYITIQNPYVTTDLPAICRNTPFNISVILPYQPIEIAWDFKGLLPNIIEKKPASDSSWIVDNRTLYKYKIPDAFTLPTEGKYPIRITTKNPTADGCGGQQTLDYELTVYNAPAADFDISQKLCLNDSISFSDKSINTSKRNIIKWSWAFGNGDSSVNSKSVKYTYTAPGNYQIKYTVMTDIGCVSDTVTKITDIGPPPVANLLLSKPSCQGQEVGFKDSAISGQPIIKRIWGFGDGAAIDSTTATETNQHSYALGKSYIATLQITDKNNCQSKPDSLEVVVYSNPVLDFSLPSICISDAAPQFKGAGNVSGGSIIDWQWNFNDPDATASNPNIVNAATATHRYIKPGVFDIVLTATSNKGCSTTVSKKIDVNGAVITPKFAIDNSKPLCNGAVSLINESVIDYGKIAKAEIIWEAASTTVDTMPTVGKTYQHSYPKFSDVDTKAYNIKFNVYSGISCVNNYNVDVVLLASPILKFDTVLPVCSNVSTFQITQAAELGGIGGTGRFAGNGISAAGLFQPSVAAIGKNDISYIFISDNGCTDSIQKIIEVFPTPVADAGPDRGVLENGSITLSPKLITDYPVSYLWAPDKFLNNPDIANAIVVKPTANVDYTLKIVSGKGCFTTDDIKITVLKKPVVPNIFSPNGDGVNDTWNIEGLNTYKGCVVQVYNRYGQMVYRSISYNKPWDGRINNIKAPIGTYYYIIDPKNGKEIIRGFLDIIW